MKILKYKWGFYQAPTGVGRTSWPFHDLFMLVNGEMIFHGGEQTLHLKTSDGVLIPPHVPFHSPETLQSSKILVVHFQADSCEDSGVNSILQKATVNLFRGMLEQPHIIRIIQRLGELHHQKRLEEDDFLVTHLLWALLGELRHAEEPQDVGHAHQELLRQVCQWAKKNVGEIKTVSLLAQRAEMSESHFRKTFREIYQISAGTWLDQMRALEAQRLLSSTNIPIKEISRMLGYASVEIFHRAFVRHEGQTPGKFRTANPPLL